ncbi:MAG: RluA family pseudouridine synthase [Fusobacteriaceae bacterium]
MEKKELAIKETIEIKSDKTDAGKRLDIFVQEYLQDATRSYVQNLIENGCVSLGNSKKIKCGSKIKGIENIVISIPEDEILDLEPENIPIDIIYEDEDMAIINKGPNMVVHPAQGNYTGTLVNAVLYHVKDLSGINGVIRPGIVHRLDKDTSGIIVIAKNDVAHLSLSGMFKEKTLEKTYICICKGNFKIKEGRIVNLIGRDPRDRKKMAVVDENGKEAISNYVVLDEVRDFSLVKVRIETGRTHQIRVHMKSLNHPIVGDSVYGNGGEIASRQMLHSYTLKFRHPVKNHEMVITAPLPEDFRNVAKRLGLDISKID